MVKKKSAPYYDSNQHTSTSEAVKLRPRKRLLKEAVTKVEERDNVLNSCPLSLAHLDELYKIWDADKRIPTVESRRNWAAARNLAPQDIHRFFSRQKGLLKKARKSVPKGTYTLPIGTPPVIKREEDIPPSKPQSRPKKRSKIKEEQREIPLRSDDVDATSSDTLVASPVSEKKYALQRPWSSSSLPPSSPPARSSPILDSTNPSSSLCLPSPPPRISSPDNPPAILWCVQGRAAASQPMFTCALCTPDMEPSNDSIASMTEELIYTQDSFSSIDPRLMGLSALPFIHRSSDLIRRKSALPDSTQWFFDLVDHPTFTA